MAYRRLSLPVLRVTKRPATGRTSLQFVHDEIPGPSSSASVGSGEEEGSREEENTAPFPDGEDTVDPFIACSTSEPTLHELESRASATAWQKIRKDIMDTVTETAAMPLNQVCVHCDKHATLRCEECGPLGYFCLECFDNAHRAVNRFHVAEKWENDHYVPLMTERFIDVRPDHVCETKKQLFLHCLDEHGVEHKVQFTYCTCEPLIKTLCRAQLWPATPCNPHYVFSFALLDWAEALLLECQVALKDFCSALNFRAPFSTQKRRDFYSSMIDAFEEFRFMKHNLKHLNYISSHLDSGNVCPACPQSGGKVIYAMDALFGLPRKKSAGVSYREPLLGNLFFGDQSSVDQFVSESQKTKSQSSACNDFLAGGLLRSATRYKALDETAVFGCSCRHEFPAHFINLKHGERLAYAVWMLDNLISKHLCSGSQLYVMYDIACTLRTHLQSAGRADILSCCQLCLPIFHSYGHKASCQVLFGPRRCEGIGLTDGETMERLWSYMRRYSRMTKEMRPSHRIDVLCSALTHYGMHKKNKLASLLLVRLERALKVKAVTEETLREDMPALFREKEKECEIQKWLTEESASCSVNPTLQSYSSMWQIEYFKTLQMYYAMRSGEVDEHIHGKLACLERKLSEIERAYSLSRWLPTDHEYTENQRRDILHKREQLLLVLWKSSQRRLFLLKLKQKYAEGQKIAKKLSSQISKEGITIRSLLEKYNACEAASGPHTCSLSVSEAFDPSVLETRLQTLGVWCSLASGEKREIIDSYLLLCRCKEEISLLQEDADNVIAYYENKKEVLEKEVHSRSSQRSLYNRGVTALLQTALSETARRLNESIRVRDLIKDSVHETHSSCRDYDEMSTSSESSSDELEL